MSLHILWDDSQIWGLLAVRAARDMGLPYRLVRGFEVAGGLFERERPSLFLVPGGNAGNKARGLGASGLEAVRAYVAGGGAYLGFCGGAGLALTWTRERGQREQHGERAARAALRKEDGALRGLGLCPWRRAGFSERLQHFMSGHLHAGLADGGRKAGPAQDLYPEDLPEAPRLPVWWPGRFEFRPESGVTVLASYQKPADDFWLADLAIADLPGDVFAAWSDLYGLSFNPAFLAGQPCVIHGRYGAGDYLLSYSHLETPDSPHANLWLAHIFRALGKLCPERDLLPPWRPRGKAALWEDRELRRTDELMNEVLQTGLRQGLFFSRTDWLTGWRTGIAGASLNNIWTALAEIRAKAPGEAAFRFWKEKGRETTRLAELFSKGCVQHLLSERLAMTLAKAMPETVPPALLRDQREALFGPAMRAGGLYRDIMACLDELAFLQLQEP